MMPELIYFDSSTNSAYFEMVIAGSYDILMPNPLKITIDSINFGFGTFEEILPVSLTALPEADTIPMLDSISRSAWGLRSEYIEYMLVPTRGENFPAFTSVDNDQWLSGISIIDGRLHVQNGTFIYTSDNIRFRTFGSVSLIGLDGEQIFACSSISFVLDENFQIVDFSTLTSPYDFVSTPYSFIEQVFSIDVNNLESYTLALQGMYSIGIVGDWVLAVYANGTGDQNNTRIWSGSAAVMDSTVDSILLSPLGVRVNGSVNDGDGLMFALVSLETTDGIIELHRGGGGSCGVRFESTRWADSPIDIGTVTAVIINGVRIPL